VWLQNGRWTRKLRSNMLFHSDCNDGGRIFLRNFRFLWPCIVSKVWRERKPKRCNNQMFIINFCLNMFRASLCPSSGEQRPCVTVYGVMHWNKREKVDISRTSTFPRLLQHRIPYAVTHGLCSPEDGHNDARNMLRQKLIINIWLLHLVGFLALHTFLWNVDTYVQE